MTFDAAARLAALDVVVTALAHPARRQILMTIHFRDQATAGDIAGRFAHTWPTTTRHLRVLEDAGLIQHNRSGRTRVYSVNRERLAMVSEWLSWFNLPKVASTYTSESQDEAELKYELTKSGNA